MDTGPAGLNSKKGDPIMQIILKDNLCRLRRERGVTQEAVAEHLGITAQSVGKWERGEGFPDITLLPALALYFNVTVDDLLGVGKARQQEQIKELFHTLDALAHKNDHDAALEILEKAYREFPNEHRILFRYLSELHWSERDWKDPDSAALAIRLGEQILAESDNDDLRRNTIVILCRVYNVCGDKGNSIRYAKMLGNYYQTSNENLVKILRGEAGELQRQENIRELTEMLCSVLLHGPEKGKPGDDLLRAEKCLDLLRLIYDEGDYGFAAVYLYEAQFARAFALAETEDADRCLEALSQTADAALFVEAELGRECRHKSLLVNRLIDRPQDTNEYHVVPHLREQLSEHSVFAFLRGDERMQNIVERLTDDSDRKPAT